MSQGTSRGGLIVDELVAEAIEGVGLDGIRKHLTEMDAERLDDLQHSLEKLSTSREPLEAIVAADALFTRVSCGWIGRWGELMKTIDGDPFSTTIRRFRQRVIAQWQLIVAESAVRRHILLKVRRPTRLRSWCPSILRQCRPIHTVTGYLFIDALRTDICCTALEATVPMTVASACRIKRQRWEASAICSSTPSLKSMSTPLASRIRTTRPPTSELECDSCCRRLIGADSRGRMQGASDSRDSYRKGGVHASFQLSLELRDRHRASGDWLVPTAGGSTKSQRGVRHAAGWERGAKLADAGGNVSHTYPRRSRDGRRVAFDTFDEKTKDRGFYVVYVDGTGLRRLGDGSMPDWSPDGKQIVTHRFVGVPRRRRFLPPTITAKPAS